MKKIEEKRNNSRAKFSKIQEKLRKSRNIVKS